MYLGLDLGTSGVKALLIDDSQRIVGAGHGALDVSRPHHGWSEQAPDDWVEACRSALAELRTSHPKQLAAVEGIGLSGQMHGATLLDRMIGFCGPASCGTIRAATPRPPRSTPTRVSAPLPAISSSPALLLRNSSG